jgi:hypothetical protein
MKSENENKWTILHSVNDWIKVSDAKALGLIGAQGVFLAFAFSALISKEFAGQTNCLVSLTLSIGLTSNFLSLLFAFLSINPRLKLRGGISPLYFGSIAENLDNSREYSQMYKERLNSESDMGVELDGQIFVNSRIAWRKFKNVTWSVRFMFISLIIWILYMITMLWAIQVAA